MFPGTPDMAERDFENEQPAYLRESPSFTLNLLPQWSVQENGETVIIARENDEDFSGGVITLTFPKTSFAFSQDDLIRYYVRSQGVLALLNVTKKEEISLGSVQGVAFEFTAFPSFTQNVIEKGFAARLGEYALYATYIYGEGDKDKDDIESMLASMDAPVHEARSMEPSRTFSHTAFSLSLPAGWIVEELDRTQIMGLQFPVQLYHPALKDGYVLISIEDDKGRPPRDVVKERFKQGKDMLDFAGGGKTYTYDIVRDQYPLNMSPAVSKAAWLETRFRQEGKPPYTLQEVDLVVTLGNSLVDFDLRYPSDDRAGFEQAKKLFTDMVKASVKINEPLMNNRS